ncbi:type II secretion system F family protein [Humibacillus xanthopallidus]|uniref:Tight adherence protein C n=1 Tax=Humibacillus xanthopallidus TaxID=412689 RepID=A0A543I1S7_9MICO|nr:type II secretion system F family protein [Humibacillus xanthopallidus]TQM64548.1 tight adherence protein C [Humibacillus xanthopallidus]
MTLVYVGAGLVALALVALILMLAMGSTAATGVARSLQLVENSVNERVVLRSELPLGDRILAPIYDRTRGLALRLSPSGTTARLTRMLDRAGNPPPWTAERLLGLKGAALLLGSLVGIALGGWSFGGLLYVIVLGAFGFYLPDVLLYNVGIRRRDETAKGLADALDMLTVCVEAGQGFDAALLQVARNVEGPIAGEFARLLSEVQIGKTRAEAFSDLGDRIDLPEVKNFTTSLVQADRLGIPIASVLREQTSAMRVVRRQKAEEKAQKITVKILFPVMFCIFPALFVVVVGPGVVRMVDTLGNL